MSGEAYIRHILSIYSAYIATGWKAGGREGDEREIAGLSSRAANKEDDGEEADIERKDSELSLGEADKEEGKLRAITRRSEQRGERKRISRR